MEIQKIVTYYHQKEGTLYLWLLLPFGGDYLEREPLVNNFVKATNCVVDKIFGNNTQCVIRHADGKAGKKLMATMKEHCADVETLH